MRISDRTLETACRIPSDGTPTENTIHDLSLDLRDARARIRELEAALRTRTPLYLPVITDEICELLEGSSLIIEHTNGSREWTQDAVEFACILNRQCSPLSETTVDRTGEP